MPFLLDTNVLSEGRKPAGDPKVVTWLSSTPLADQYISVLTVGEIGRGIARLRRRGDDRQAEVYREWLRTVVATFGRRIAPVTVDVASIWGELDPGHIPPTVDALIGATAKARDWTLVTRNTRDFRNIGVKMVNPFTDEEGR